MALWTKVRVLGPLAPYAPAFGQELRSWGFTDLSTREQLQLMAHLSGWMSAERLDILNGAHVTAYCTARRADGYTARLTPSSLQRVQDFLQSQGVLCLPPPVPEQPVTPDDELLARYKNYMDHERGLVEAVVSRFLRVAARFVSEHSGLAARQPPLGAAEVSAFCVRELPRHSRSTAPNVASALRSFLRFLHLEGIVDSPLAQAVPWVANRKGTGLPRGLPRSIVTQMLASCDRRTRQGRRDYAILMLLARLGLRAGEVAAMSLEDLDWRSGELVVHGKGGRHDRLPLPIDVGDALAGYLRRGRPQTISRRVFLTVKAPTVDLSSRAVSWTVRAACDRAGVPSVGAHRLRHCLATELLRAGSSLVEVGQVLRHADIATTSIYAKVDHLALDALVLPWPGAAQ
jgi:site-specific recombinase XerD